MGEGKVIESEFPLEEPPTLPHRSTSGAVIKAPVMKAFQSQSTAERACNTALDRLINLVRSVELDEVPHPLRDSLRPLLAPITINGRYAVKGG